MLTRAIMPTDFAVLHYECFNAETSADGLHLVDGVTTDDSTQRAVSDAPSALPNIGNTCYFSMLS